jgi:hypothetical protein
MRVFHLKALTAVFLFATVVLTGWAWQIVNSPVADLSLRPLSQSAKLLLAKTVRPNTDEAASLSNVFTRPLFRPDRKPFVPKEVAVVEPAPQALPPAPEPVPVPAPEPLPIPVVQAPPPPPVFPQITLRGIRLTGQNDAALLETPDFPLGQWFPVGSDLSSWRLKSITDDGVTFVSGDLTQVLQLYVDNPAKSVGNPQ